MKTIYCKLLNKRFYCTTLIMILFSANSFTAKAIIKKTSTTCNAQYHLNKKMCTIQGDFTLIAPTNLRFQKYRNDTSYSNPMVCIDRNRNSNTLYSSCLKLVLFASVDAQINVSCKGGNDGSVTINATGGSAPYTITPAQTGLTAGLKTFTVKDAKGNETTVTATITEPDLDLSAICINHVDVSCKGGNDGSMVISPTGGTAPYIITPAQTGLTAGIKTFVVKDAKGCETTVIANITEPDLDLSAICINHVDVSCKGGNDGSVVISPTGGTAPYTITPAQTGLTAGIKTFVVKDAKGCETTVTAHITEPDLALSATASQINVSCKGANDGSVVITPAGGTAPYSISPAQTGLTAGLKTFIVKDAKGCETTVSATIIEPQLLLCTIQQIKSVTVNGNSDGIATVFPSGGVTPYTYKWDNGETTETATALKTGSHSIIVADKNNCTTTCQLTITLKKPTIIAEDDTINNVNGDEGKTNAGNILIDNGNGNDTLNGVNVTIDQINITIDSPAVSIGGAPVPVVDIVTGQISVPAGTPAGTYIIIYTICDKLNPTICDPAMVTIIVDAGLVLDCQVVVVRNALTPNNDTFNDYLRIDGVDDTNCYPNGVSVEIYNRWGVLVFETDKYNNESNYFDGISRGRTTINKQDGLPTGTYFYIVKYQSVGTTGNLQTNRKEGFLFLSR